MGSKVRAAGPGMSIVFAAVIFVSATFTVGQSAKAALIVWMIMTTTMTNTVPRVEKLFELGQMLEPEREDHEFWRWLVVAACNDLCPIMLSETMTETERVRYSFRALCDRRFFDWNGKDNHLNAEAAICGEINQFLNRVFDNTQQQGTDDMAPAATGKRKAVERVEQKATKGAKEDKPKVVESAADLLDGVEVVEERDVEYSKIVRSKHNPRQSFDGTLIAEMRPNIVTICQMNPLTIREGTNELIDGETRHRAAEGVAKTLRCKIVRCTDAQAACIRLQTSMQRRDLNPIEKAQALQSLIDSYGYTQRQMERIVKMKQGAIANLTRLLKLPDEWKQRVISKEIKGTAARDLVPWVDEPAVLANVTREMKALTTEEKSLALPEIIEQAVIDESRPLKGYCWHKQRNIQVDLKPYEEQLIRLRMRKVTYCQQEVERAFNVSYWEELLGEEEERRIAAMERREARGQSAKEVDPKKAAENELRQAQMFQKKLYRYKTAWLQKMLADKVHYDATKETTVKFAFWFAMRSGSHERREGCGATGLRRPDDLQELASVLERESTKLWNWAKELLSKWILLPFDKYDSALQPDMIEAMAAHLDIDLKRDWSGDCLPDSSTAFDDYLGLLTTSQLIDLCAEWKLKLHVVGKKRAELIKEMKEEGLGKPVPKALLNVKPCSLT